MIDHAEGCPVVTGAACTCGGGEQVGAGKQCHSRHEPMPGVHQDTPHPGSQCLTGYVIVARQLGQHLEEAA